MANGRNNYGFNVVGAQGLPSLISTPQIQPSRGLNIPVPAIRKERQSGRDTTRAALLGALAPSLAGAALKGLAEIPALEKFIYEAREDKPTAAEADLSGPITDPRLVELQQRRAELDKQYPSLKLPKTQTNFGNLLENILTYAPGLALGDEPGTAQAFLGTAQSARKLSDTLRATRAAAAADREKTRFTKLLELDKPFEKAITNSSILTPQGGFQPFQREVLISPNKTTAYILSRGEEAIDQVTGADGKSYVVKAGEYYINPDYVLSDEELPDPEYISVFDKDTNAQSTAVKDVIVVNGRKVPRLRVHVKDELVDYNVLRQQGKEYLVNDQDLPAPNTVNILDTNTNEAEIAYRDTVLQNGVMVPRLRINVNGKFVDINDPSLKDRNYIIAPASLATDKAVSVGGVSPALVKTFVDYSDQHQLVRKFVGVGEDTLELLYTYDKAGNTDLTSTVSGLYKIADAVKREVNSFLKIANIQDNYGFQTNAASNVFDLANQQVSLNQDGTAATQEERLANAQKLAQELKKLKTEEGKSIDSFLGMDIDSDGFVQLLADRASLVAGQIRLAYAAAAADGQTGTALSDADVTNFLISVGANQSNPKVIGGLISKVLRDSIAKVEGGPFTGFSGKTSNDKNVRNYLISVLGVSADDLNKISEEDLDEKERERLLDRIQQAMLGSTYGYANLNFQPSEDGKSIRYRSFEDIERIDRPNLFVYLDHFQPIEEESSSSENTAPSTDGPRPGDSDRRRTPQ